MKIICPEHDDTIPSCHLYTDHYHCFVCGAHGSLDQLDKEEIKQPRNNPFKSAKITENVDRTLEAISKMDKKLIRGFELPFNHSGYYIVYPNHPYYVQRLWHADSSNKYRGPIGHKKPLYIPLFIRPQISKILYVVEGQLNALTIQQGLNFTYAVVSPGSANDLNNPNFIKHYLQYDKICIIVDKDAPGVVAGLQLKNTLIQNNKRVVLFPMEKDLNDLYVSEGREALDKAIKETLALF